MKKTKKFLFVSLLMLLLATIAVFSYRYFSEQKIIEHLETSSFYKDEYKKSYLELYKSNSDLDTDLLVLMGNNGIETIDDRMKMLWTNEQFDKERFVRYYQYLKNNDENSITVTYEQCLAVVNKDVDLYEPIFRAGLMDIIDLPDMDGDKITRYLNLFASYPSASVVTLVNNDIDLVNVSADQYENVLELLNQRYFIKKNLKRYLDYYVKHTSLSKAEVIKRVNSNIDKPFYSDDKSTDLSKGNLLICNKFNKLASDYVPANLVTISSKYSDAGARLVKEAAEAFEYMCGDAKNYGQTIKAFGDNGYRSYSYQRDVYNYYVSVYGVAETDEISARPGYSEHQSGLAIDVMVNGSKYNTNHQLDWLMANSYKYGFIFRYQDENEYITGYQYEPWHYRYVGKEVALQIHDEGLTFEEYYAYYVMDNTITTEQFIELFK